MAINWGSAFGSGNYQGKLGIETTVVSESATQITIKNAVYYRSRYAITDSGNNFWVDWDNYADSYVGTISIKHTVNGTSWSDSNITYIGSWQATFNKTVSSQTGYFSARCSGLEYGGSGGTHYISFTIPALTKYYVYYDANDGSGVKSIDTATYGTDYYVKENIFSRPGYEWVGWNEKPDGTGIDWTSYAGKNWTYTYQRNVTLYAIWKRTSNIRVKVNGKNALGIAWVKVDGVYQMGVKVYVKDSGTYKEGT